MTNASAKNFDAAPDAHPMFKERVLWAMLMGLFFALVHGGMNEISGLTVTRASFLLEWKSNLPFVPELIVPYMSLYPVVLIAFLMSPTRQAVQKLALRSSLAIVITAAFFLAIPVEFSFQRPEISGWPKFWFDLSSFDRPHNRFPSLQISLGFLAWHTITGEIKGVYRVMVTVWFLLLAASTVLVFQHYFFGLPGGVAIAALIFWLVPETGRSMITLNFVTPRHLQMGLRYLVLASIAAVAASNVASQSTLVAGLNVWICLSMLLVAGGYVLGANGFLQKGRNGHSPFIWFLFWPYLAGSFLNWCYWRTRVPLMSEVKPGLWIGARPGRKDWVIIRRVGIGMIIDLVPELPVRAPQTVSHTHIPLLDITIPDPSSLDQIAIRIDAAVKNQGVLVHCALGMSRSVLAICAWLIRRGHTVQESLAIIDLARPERVTRSYITVSLELYEDYLRNGKPATQ